MGAARGLFWGGLAIAIVPALGFVYLTMPLPGSQQLELMHVAYGLHKIERIALGLGAALALAGAAWWLARRPARRARITIAVAMALSAYVIFETRRNRADQVFLPPQGMLFARGITPEVGPESIVLGVVIDGQARAYPVRLLAYHHLVEDELAGAHLMPTY